MGDLLKISTLNCERFIRSCDFTKDYLLHNQCDILCKQETWHLDENIKVFNTISSDYIYTAISGLNSRACILTGVPVEAGPSHWRRVE